MAANSRLIPLSYDPENPDAVAAWEWICQISPSRKRSATIWRILNDVRQGLGVNVAAAPEPVGPEIDPEEQAILDLLDDL